MAEKYKFYSIFTLKSGSAVGAPVLELLVYGSVYGCIDGSTRIPGGNERIYQIVVRRTLAVSKLITK